MKFASSGKLTTLQRLRVHSTFHLARYSGRKPGIDNMIMTGTYLVEALDSFS